MSLILPKSLRKIKNTIAFRLILAASLIVSFIDGIEGIHEYHEGKDKLNQLAQANLTLVGTRLQSSLPLSIWDFAESKVDKAIDAELNTPFVRYISLRTAELKRDYGQPLDSNQEYETVIAELVYAKDGESQRLGELEIYLDYAQISKELEYIFVAVILEMISVNLVLILSLLVLTQYLVARPLLELREAMTDMAQGEGDLTQRLKTRRIDEIGIVALKLNIFIEKLQHMVGQIVNLISNLNESSGLVRADTEQIQVFLDIQQQESEQFSKSILELSSNTQQAFSFIQMAVEASTNARQTASEIQQQMEVSGDSVRDLSGQLNQAVEVINQLSDSVTGIVSMVEVIRGVAEQTNLLALNAAIEAARAGEQGRGFAVVADEVRALASRTRESTEEINQIIESLQQAASSAVDVVTQSQNRSEETVEAAQAAITSVQKVASQSDEVTEFVEQISNVIKTQSDFSESLNQGVNHIVDTGKNCSLIINNITEQVAELDVLSEQIKRLMKDFKIN